MLWVPSLDQLPPISTVGPVRLVIDVEGDKRFLLYRGVLLLVSPLNYRQNVEHCVPVLTMEPLDHDVL